MNTMKLRGLMDLLAAALDERSRFHYDPTEGICGITWPSAWSTGWATCRRRTSFGRVLPVARTLWPR